MVREYQGLVYTVCYQLVRDEDTAQDLAQETFLAAWRAADRCPPGFEKQWLARIAANKAKDHLRSAWARKMTTPGDEVLATLPHPLPALPAGGVRPGRGRPPLPPARKDPERPALAGQKDAAGRDRTGTTTGTPDGKEERGWNCSVTMAA